MKTNNLGLDLMVPSQINKDIIYNESILKLDEFAHIAVSGFIDKVPAELNIGEKFIILNGGNKGNICYRSHESKPVLIHQARIGMLAYLVHEKKFVFFTENGWQDCLTKGEEKPANFTSVQGQHVLQADKQRHALYLNGDCMIIAKDLRAEVITLIVKQSHKKRHKISWSDNILWKNAKVPQAQPSANSFCLIKLYPLPETDHYLGDVVGENFKY